MPDNTADRVRKVFALLDSDIEGEREAALHQLYELLHRDGRSFRQILELLETTVPAATYEELLRRYNDAAARCEEWKRAHDKLAQRQASARRRPGPPPHAAAPPFGANTGPVRAPPANRGVAWFFVMLFGIPLLFAISGLSSNPPAPKPAHPAAAITTPTPVAARSESRAIPPTTATMVPATLSPSPPSTAASPAPPAPTVDAPIAPRNAVPPALEPDITELVHATGMTEFLKSGFPLGPLLDDPKTRARTRARIAHAYYCDPRQTSAALAELYNFHMTRTRTLVNLEEALLDPSQRNYAMAGLIYGYDADPGEFAKEWAALRAAEPAPHPKRKRNA
jgi:hypothetical protein